MCGFVGMFGKNAPTQHEALKNATQSIIHRGSNAIEPHFYTHNAFGAGFVRLDICDLHTRANQPFFLAGYDFVMCFNGEIYNFLELRARLESLGYVFCTTSDTEVLYLAYHHYGESCFSQLRGMFALSIYHIKEQRLILARDHFGIKPLYYAYLDKTLYFASEIKAFKSFFPFQANAKKILEFLSYGCSLDKHLIYQHIYELMPGQILSFQNEKIKQRNYFNLLDTFMPKQNTSPSLEIIESALLESVNLHCQCDVDFASQLSGGLDSSFITALATKYNKNLNALSVNFAINEIDESYFQNLLASKLGIKKHSLLFDGDFILAKWREAIFYDDFPLHHPNILASNALSSLAHQLGFKMLLSGDGADELFCGYAWHLRQAQNLQNALDLLSYVPIKMLESVLFLPHSPTPKILQESYKQLKNETKMNYLGQKIYLQKWLRRQDRSGMKSSVEIRVPFVDIKLAQLLNPLSIAEKSHHYTQSKAILKTIAERYLPHELIYQQKIGFPSPIREFFASKKAQILFDMLLSHKAKARGIYNYKALQTIIESHRQKKTDCSRILWLISNLELWLQMLGE